MSEEYIGTTQEIFQDVITKPKLLDKYLRRPPFRFIHDIIINTMNVTGFPEGLFEGNELNGKLIKDKHDKISWLNKLIQCIESVHNQPLNVNPNKLVAGLEPEYTNEMLQIFGKIAIDVANGEISMQDIFNNMNGNNSDNNPSLQQDEQSQQEQIQDEQQESQPQPQPHTEINENNNNNNMEENELKQDENWVNKTQETLGKLIERPRLLEKLLRRPPFRFLHDIIKSLIKSTGYPLQFLDENKDITNANIKDAKFKYYFLSKLIIIISATINEDLSFIDPKNIIAGRKPEDTNYLLTKLANASSLQININQIKEKIITISENKKSARKEEKQKQLKEENIKTEENIESVGKNTARKTVTKTAPVMPKLELDQLKINNVENGMNDDNKPIKPSSILNERLSKRQMQQQHQQQQQEKPFQAIQKLQRPRTARRAPPKLKSNVIDDEKEDEIDNETDILIMNDDINNENNENEIDDIDDDIDDDIETIDNMNDMSELNGFIDRNDNMILDLENENDGKHGKLVRDILDAQSGIKLETTRLGTHRRGDSAKSVEKIENMREMIQKLCQTCVPLGKCIDFVFEDVESINNELLKWKQQIRKNKKILIKEKEKTNEILIPLQKELQKIENEIKHQNQLILEKKAVLLRNETKTNDIILKRLLNE